MSSTASQDALDLASRNPLSFLPAAPVVLSYTNIYRIIDNLVTLTTYYSAPFSLYKKNNSLSLDLSFHSNLHFTLLIIYSKSYLFCRESNKFIVLFENSSFLCATAVSRVYLRNNFTAFDSLKIDKYLLKNVASAQNYQKC